MHTQSTLKSIGIMSVATFLSRILGFIREIFFGYFFGTSSVAAAFIIAFRIPNLLRFLFAEGALSTAFVPVFTRYLTHKTKDEMLQMTNVILNTLLILLIFITILGIIFAPFIIQIITLSSEKLISCKSLLINLLRIVFPYIIFIFLSAFCMGILYSYNHFFIPALSPMVLNLAMIGSFFFICPFFGRSLTQKIYGLAIGVLIGGLGQVIIQIPILLRKGIVYRPVLNFSHPGLKEVLKLMLPAIVGLAAMQINTFVDTMLACRLGTYAIAALNYGNRIMLLPLGVFGISIANVAFPNMSICAAKNDFSGLKEHLASGLKLSFFLMLPATVAFIILSVPITKVLFQRGKFDLYSTIATSKALLFYSTGLFAYAGVKIVASAFYSLKDTVTPLKIAMLSIFLNIILNLLLMIPLKHGGLALATALASFFNLSILILILRKKINGMGGKNILSALIKILKANLVLILFCLLAVNNLIVETSINILAVKLILIIILGILVYILSAYLFKVEEIKNITRLIFSKS